MNAPESEQLEKSEGIYSWTQYIMAEVFEVWQEAHWVVVLKWREVTVASWRSTFLHGSPTHSSPSVVLCKSLCIFQHSFLFIHVAFWSNGAAILWEREKRGVLLRLMLHNDLYNLGGWPEQLSTVCKEQERQFLGLSSSIHSFNFWVTTTPHHFIAVFWRKQWQVCYYGEKTLS